MLTINVSKDQRPNKRKLNPIRADHVIYNLELDATKRLNLVDGIALPIDGISHVSEDNPPILLKKVTQIQENALVYKHGDDYYVKKTPWKNEPGKKQFNFIGCMVDIPQFSAYLNKVIFIDLYLKTENNECVYGTGPKYKF